MVEKPEKGEAEGEGKVAVATEGGFEAAEVVGAAEIARSIPGALQVTSIPTFALWAGRFSAVVVAFIIGARLADRNYNSR